MTGAAEDENKGLGRAYDEIARERDRLRNARGSATQLLGPASAAIAIGLFGALARPLPASILIIAGGLFILMILIGILYDNLPPYRVLRAGAEKKIAGEGGTRQFELGFQDDVSEAAWLGHAIEVERQVYGSLPSKHRRFRLWKCGPEPTLQELYEVERSGGYLVRLTFLLLITDLIVGTILAR